MCIYVLLLTEVNHITVKYGMVESRRRGAGTSVLYMKSRNEFFEYAVKQYTSIDEEVLDVGDGKTFDFYTNPVKLYVL